MRARVIIYNPDLTAILLIHRQKAVPDISGEEKERSTSTNVYRPAWVTLSELLKINLMPPALSNKILAVIK